MEKQIEEQSQTMQAALALSPSNKASTRLANGDVFLVQEYAHEHYRIWIVPPCDIPIWSGKVDEHEIDAFPHVYGIDPGKRVWRALGADNDTEAYQAMEAALQVLAGQIIQLRTEVLVLKAEVTREKGNA